MLIGRMIFILRHQGELIRKERLQHIIDFLEQAKKGYP